MMPRGPGYLVHLDPEGSFAEAWTAWHLPFLKLSAAQAQYRDQLREAVAGLRTIGRLDATYTSQEVRWAPDLENVLFYNLGTSVFRGVAADALRFVRKSAPAPDCPAPLDFRPLHHVRYQVGTAHAFLPAPGAIVACAEAACMDMKDLRELAGLWRSFKAAMVSIPGASGQSKGPISLRMVIKVPESWRLNLAEVVKPLTDAFISALHSCNGGHLEAVTNLLAKRLRCSPEMIREMLLKTEGAVLGPRAVPHLRGDGLQWSPADDLLVGGELVRAPSAGELISVRGELSSVSARR